MKDQLQEPEYEYLVDQYQINMYRNNEALANYYLGCLIEPARQIFKNYGYRLDDEGIIFLKEVALHYSNFLECSFMHFLSKCIENNFVTDRSKDQKRSDHISAQAYSGTGYHAFDLKYFTSSPESLVVNSMPGPPKHPDADPEIPQQTDTEISDMIDSILFG